MPRKEGKGRVADLWTVIPIKKKKSIRGTARTLPKKSCSAIPVVARGEKGKGGRLGVPRVEAFYNSPSQKRVHIKEGSEDFVHVQCGKGQELTRGKGGGKSSCLATEGRKEKKKKKSAQRNDDDQKNSTIRGKGGNKSPRCRPRRVGGRNISLPFGIQLELKGEMGRISDCCVAAGKEGGTFSFRTLEGEKEGGSRPRPPFYEWGEEGRKEGFFALVHLRKGGREGISHNLYRLGRRTGSARLSTFYCQKGEKREKTGEYGSLERGDAVEGKNDVCAMSFFHV